MKLPLLVLSLILLYWTCNIHAEKDTAQDFTDSDEYVLDYQYGTSLSRSKRGIIPFISPLEIISKVLGKSVGLMLKPALSFGTFVFKAIMIDDACPKIDKLPTDLIKSMMTSPIETSKTMLCYTLNAMGKPGRKMMRKGLECGIEFTKRQLIPGLHTGLNALKSTGVLPPTFVAMIDMFNAVYLVFKMLGYVG